jgi:phage tail-like protein
MQQAAMLGMALAMLVTTGAGAARIDPYKSHRPNHVAVLATSSEVVKHRAGGDPGLSVKSPGRNKFEAITLKRGVTQDPAFANWAAAAKSGAHGGRRHHP